MCVVIVQALSLCINGGLHIHSCMSVLTAAKLYLSTTDPSIHTCGDSGQTLLEHSAQYVCVAPCVWCVCVCV